MPKTTNCHIHQRFKFSLQRRKRISRFPPETRTPRFFIRCLFPLRCDLSSCPLTPPILGEQFVSRLRFGLRTESYRWSLGLLRRRSEFMSNSVTSPPYQHLSASGERQLRIRSRYKAVMKGVGPTVVEGACWPSTSVASRSLSLQSRSGSEHTNHHAELLTHVSNNPQKAPESYSQLILSLRIYDGWKTVVEETQLGTRNRRVRTRWERPHAHGLISQVPAFDWSMSQAVRQLSTSPDDARPINHRRSGRDHRSPQLHAFEFHQL